MIKENGTGPDGGMKLLKKSGYFGGEKQEIKTNEVGGGGLSVVLAE